MRPGALFRRLFGWRPVTARNHRVYAIGDIHGRFDLFNDLIGRIESDNVRRADRKHVTLVVLGDVIDRGPDSRRLLRLLMSAQQRSARLFMLLGNHEAMLLESVAGNSDAQEAWMRYGGLATLESFGIEPPLPHEDGAQFGARLARALTAADRGVAGHLAAVDPVRRLFLLPRRGTAGDDASSPEAR